MRRCTYYIRVETVWQPKRWSGALGEFTPFVALGAYLHVGKNATIGLGRYEILHRVDTSNEGRTIKKC